MILIGSGFIPVSLSGSALLLVVPLMVLAALMLDRLLAEPARCHPLVAFGRWAAWLEVRLNSPHPARSRLAGWLAMLLALTPWCVVVLLMYLAAAQLWLWLILNVLVLYSCIGWQSLQRHVVAVASASDSEQARARLGLIVSRDTQSLSDDEIAQSACESLLENSTDALFASLFWFALGGAPAALLHRWVNTLDAMWGYRNPRFRFFGTPVARLDDLMAFWPARISAYTSKDIRSRFLTDFGFAAQSQIDEQVGANAFLVNVPQEDLTPIDVDLLMWTETANLPQALDGIALRKTMRAYREGREIYADPDLTAALAHSSPLSLDYAIEHMIPLVAAAMDGDPKTQVATMAAEGVAP